MSILRKHITCFVEKIASLISVILMILSFGRSTVLGRRTFTKMATKMSKYSPHDAKVLEESEMVCQLTSAFSTRLTLTEDVIV